MSLFTLLPVAGIVILCALTYLKRKQIKEEAEKLEQDARLKVSLIVLPLKGLTFDFLHKAENAAETEWKKVSVSVQAALAGGKSIEEHLESVLKGHYGEEVKVSIVTDADKVKDTVKAILDKEE